MDNDLLQRLRDIHEPAAPAFWPPAIGWWIVAVLSVIALVVAVRYLQRRHVQRAPYRAALAEARDLGLAASRGDLDVRSHGDSINAVLKRLLVHVEHLRQVPALHGDAWLEYLGERFDEPAFTSGPGRALGDARYQPQVADHDGLQQLVESVLERAFRTRARGRRTSRLPWLNQTPDIEDRPAGSAA